MCGTVVELRAAKIPGWMGFFADHYWLLVLTGVEGESHTTCDRWEVWQHANGCDSSWGHLHKNLLDPFQGVGNGPSRSIKQWSGDDAAALIKIIDSAPDEYPFNNRYGYWPGPNSNTFAQWVVRDQIRLGIRAIGRDFPVPRHQESF
jgi:hypothetical protein